ncbi:MAG: hypothetical protein ACI86H_002616 [bacterium]|jgi:uncharacterized protein YggT (Ycf19 family)
MNFVSGIAKLAYWILTIYSWANILAIVFSWINADPDNPIVQRINQATRPFWDWIETKIALALRPFSAYLALLIIMFGEIALPGTIRSIGALLVGFKNITLFSSLMNVSLYVSVGALSVVINVLWFVFLLAVAWFVITLVNPSPNSMVVRVIHTLIDPIITPIQNRLPRTSTDWSPVVLAVIAIVSNNGLQYVYGVLVRRIII